MARMCFLCPLVSFLTSLAFVRRNIKARPLWSRFRVLVSTVQKRTIAVMNSVGKIVMECVIETKARTILQFFDGLRGDVHCLAV
jgi:hypothetical protein